MTFNANGLTMNMSKERGNKIMTNTTENTTIITAELKAEYYWDKFSNAMEVWLEKPTRENRKKMNAYEKLYNKYMEVLNPTE